MSDKTLVERLRYGSTANGTCTGAENGTCASVVIRNMLDKECESRYVCTTCRNCINETMNKLADAIEREYLPRPRYEDGEPVQFGDMAKACGELGNVFEILYQDGKCVEVAIALGNEETASHYMVYDGERVKRPEPEVLDAYGVPIKVGDVVWFVGGAEYFDVLGIESNGDVHIGRDDGTSTDAWAVPSDLTHKQPDSLERIEEDATMPPREYVADRRHDVGLMDDEECTCWMCMDLLLRQREVLERGR